MPTNYYKRYKPSWWREYEDRESGGPTKVKSEQTRCLSYEVQKRKKGKLLLSNTLLLCTVLCVWFHSEWAANHCVWVLVHERGYTLYGLITNVTWTLLEMQCFIFIVRCCVSRIRPKKNCLRNSKLRTKTNKI